MEYFVDPINGNVDNDGSKNNPWRTLTEVISSNKIFAPGDVIYLRRGYHGMPLIKGINAGDVYIKAEEGHTPALGSLTLLNAHHWYISGLTISRSTIPAKHPDLLSKSFGVIIDTQANKNSHDNTIEYCFIYTRQDSSLWWEKEWAANVAGIQVYGNRNVIRHNHFYNGGSIQLGFQSNNCYVGYNINENFSSDGMGQKGNYGIIENNLIMNSYRINGNHNDLFQGWASTGNIVRNNEFRAYTDPKQRLLVNPNFSDTQGIGLFDGYYTDWTIENNVIFVDHPIGIWIQGAKNCKVKNNTVCRCGENAWSEIRPPTIKIDVKKSGGLSTGNVIINNIAESYEFASGIGYVSNNVVVNAEISGIGLVFDISGAQISGTYVAINKDKHDATYLNWRKKDVHISDTGTNVINAGTVTGLSAHFDKDGNERIHDDNLIDCGAYEYGYVTNVDSAPTKPTNVISAIISGYAVDLHWNPSTGCRKLGGYNIYCNNVKIGKTRVTPNFLAITTNITGSYTVEAFNHDGLVSEMSDPAITEISQPIEPPKDITPPTIPLNLIGTTQSESSILLRWDSSVDDISGNIVTYNIYRDGAKIQNVTETNYLDVGLTPFTTYHYFITSIDISGNESDVSNEIDVVTLENTVNYPTNEAIVSNSILWDVTVRKSGIYKLEFNYSLLSGSYIGEVEVNNQLSTLDLGFNQTNSWDIYNTVSHLVVLNEGQNTIKITVTGLNSPNIDTLIVIPTIL